MGKHNDVRGMHQHLAATEQMEGLGEVSSKMVAMQTTSGDWSGTFASITTRLTGRRRLEADLSSQVADVHGTVSLGISEAEKFMRSLQGGLGHFQEAWAGN